MGTPAAVALVFLLLALPICLWVVHADLSRLKIPNPAVAALVAVYAEQLQDARPLPISTRWDAANKAVLDTLNAIALTGADRDQSLATLLGTIEEINAR